MISTLVYEIQKHFLESGNDPSPKENIFTHTGLYLERNVPAGREIISTYVDRIQNHFYSPGIYLGINRC